MNASVTNVLFGCIGSALCGESISESQRRQFNNDMLPELLKLSLKHDVAPLVAFGLSKNGLLKGGNEYLTEFEGQMFSASIRYERLNIDFNNICDAFEAAKIPFIPLKGSVIRDLYPEPWLRTSCDADILVHPEDLKRAADLIQDKLCFEQGKTGTHDIPFVTPGGNHIELHFDLVEDYVSGDADKILALVWDNSAPIKSGCYRYKMSEEMFYFYHISHMAKHFENGGCGIRPFVDLWLLNKANSFDMEALKELLLKGGLIRFAESCSRLSSCWFSGQEPEGALSAMQDFILDGGVYGSSKNRVAVSKKNKGGKLGYFFSRVFIPYAKLKRYYPILEKHKWLTPVMQIRRWFMLLNPKVAKMAKRELKAGKNINKASADRYKAFLKEIGL